MQKAFVVLNHVAGTEKDAARVREAFAKRFADKGFMHEVYETTGREQLAEVVKDALSRGFDLVVAAGGDGTVSGVAGGLVKSGVPYTWVLTKHSHGSGKSARFSQKSALSATI